MATPFGRFTRQFEFPGYAFQSSQTPVTFDHPNPYVVTIEAGKTVTSWVKTDADTAACDLPSGHGYSNGNFDVYWTAASVNYVRYGVPGTISTNALSLDGGSGTDFPASATSGVVVCKQTTINTQIDGDRVQLIGVLMKCDSDENAVAHVEFFDSGDASIHEVDLVRYDQAGGFTHVLDIANGDTNAYTGNPITYSKASNGSATASIELFILSGDDSTP